jgi:hypothetical protein
MELTLRRFGITDKVLRDRVKESTPPMLRRVYRRHQPEHHLDHHKECLEASGSRFVSPVR